ncbi:MAG: ATP-binding protein [Chlorobiaceae bacterium]|nr:ATP-binding protein [Chlorobiaceae bacterium]
MKHAEIELTGGYSAYPDLHGFIDTFAVEMNFSTRFTETLHLTLKEAFVNAVKHGNCGREEFPVRCSLNAAGDHLQAAMHDCGKVFDPDTLPDPSDGDFFMRLSGRGVHIIRSMADISIIGRKEGEGKAIVLRYHHESLS